MRGRGRRGWEAAEVRRAGRDPGLSPGRHRGHLCCRRGPAVLGLGAHHHGTRQRFPRTRPSSLGVREAVGGSLRSLTRSPGDPGTLLTLRHSCLTGGTCLKQYRACSVCRADGTVTRHRSRRQPLQNSEERLSVKGSAVNPCQAQRG